MAKKTENCGNISGRQILVLSAWGHLTVLLLSSLITTAVEGATGTVDINTVYQQLEGFGGAAVYDCNGLTTHPKKEEIYDLLFKELGIDILRIRNTYGYPDNGLNLDATATIIAAARQPQRNPNLKVELVPWSPPAYLKSNNDINNGGTLKGGPSAYIYDDYAQWWYDSIIDWQAHGVEVNFISLQNEPDWTATYDSFRLDATQNSTNAGYDQAYEHVFEELYSQMGLNVPKMLAPETMGFGGSQTYITALNTRVQMDNIYGFSHHLYSDGSYDSPDGMISGMTSYKTNYGDHYGKTLHMTEYVKNGVNPPNFDMAWKFAWHVYNCLYYEHVTSYYNWTLFRSGSPSSGGGIVTYSSTDYTIRPQYWFLKAYAHFTDPGWYVVHTSVGGTGASNLRMSAFKNPDSNQLTVVILNITDSNTDLTLTLNGFSPTSSEVYKSSATENWVYQGTYSSSMTAPAKSITTIHLTGTSSPVFTDCDAVIAANYGLPSDISGDCYVNYKDFAIIADYWLSSDCGWLNNYCDGADLKPKDGNVDFVDFSKFAVQWMQCNDPEDPGCVHNW
jgi:glucuronoarabinoxylan endo-1,4-beta-xylanase